MTAQTPKRKKHSDYRELVVYKKSKKLTLDIFRLIFNDKSINKNFFLADQLLRSVSSIGANIAEGYGRYYKKSFRHFLAIARGSSFETEYWLELLKEIRPKLKKEIDELIKNNQEILKLLTTMMKNLDI